MFSEYSQGNCFLECTLDYAIEKMKEKNETKPCAPWYFPTSSGGNVRMCDPFDSYRFLGYMKTISMSKCPHCLPDCLSTLYDSSVTAAPFRRCDFKNLGVSPLCSLDSNIQPQIWSDSLLTQYKELGALPNYVTERVGDATNPRTNIRYHVHDKGEAVNEVVFSAQNEFPRNTYDAYEKDIATVTFFFDSPTAFVYERKARMTWVGFISQIGGLFGLCMGFSFISIIEIGYWLTIRMFKNTLK